MEPFFKSKNKGIRERYGVNVEHLTTTNKKGEGGNIMN